MDVMQNAESRSSGRSFDIPDETVRVRMDPTSGNPVSETTPDSVNALFKKGTEPKKSISPSD